MHSGKPLKIWPVAGAVLALAGLGLGLYLAVGPEKLGGEPELPAVAAGSSIEGIMAIVTPASANLPLPPALNRRGVAPDFDNDIWLNSPPLRLAGLKSRVVLV